MTNLIPIALVGIGKIARDQHIAAIAESGQFRLAATVSQSGGVPAVATFSSITAMVDGCPEIRAVSLCTPPHGRLAMVREALDHGLDVMLEKPPAATLSEAEAISAAARRSGRSVFATWHSREAAGVEPARRWLEGRRVDQVTVSWKEDVRVWHPGQEWIWAPGIGVFDPGINALSILTRLFPAPLLLTDAELLFPANRAAPIAATLALESGTGTQFDIAFDFDQRGLQTWDIVVKAGLSELRLSQGGLRLFLDGAEQPLEIVGEYPRLYQRFAELISKQESEVDLTPLQLVADAFVLGRRREVPDFDWDR